jgi:transketolase
MSTERSCFASSRQDWARRDSVLLPGVPRVAIEAGASDGWHRYVRDGAVVGEDTFGESAPASELFRHFGFTVNGAAATVKALIGRSPCSATRSSGLCTQSDRHAPARPFVA